MIDIIIEYFFKIMDLIHKIYPVGSVAMFTAVLLFDRKKLEIQLDNVAKFLAAMTILTFIKICIWNGQMVPPNPYGISMQNFLFVFLEDAFFVMIPFYLCKKIDSKILKFLIWTFFSVSFGMGHIYQGITAVFITALYPYFISNRYAQRTSFGTVMVCHFLWDCFVLLIPKINNLISVF